MRSIAACLLMAASSTVAQGVSPRNVSLVVFDDLNMDIGAHGNEQVKTPHLDAFAKQAVRFDHAHGNGPYCAPARANFITGLYPSTTGIYGDQRYRYILDPDGNEELYDRAEDPNEWHNLANDGSYAAVRREMRAQLLELSQHKRPVHK